MVGLEWPATAVGGATHHGGSIEPRISYRGLRGVGTLYHGGTKVGIFRHNFLYTSSRAKNITQNFWQASAQTTTTTLRLHINHASLLYIKYELIARGALPMFWTLVRLLPSYSWRKYAIPARATVADFGTFRVRGTGTRYGLTTLGAELRGATRKIL